ncbi:MAG: ABC transporter ATP-binding protein [Anaerolineales bacterium]|jgi:lipopolysaccharide transport system ATP-binding protein|nr:ABC transporter ATP-binding protein [Anaerolineales bacterium]
MNNVVIYIENLSKAYRLGQIGAGTLSRDLEVWWAKTRGKPTPLLKIGQTDQSGRDGEIIWSLQDINFSVKQGEILGIIGRNGAGKSTLLKVLSRVTAPTKGLVKVKGRITSLLEVGTGFHPELTGRENIYLNGAILGMSKEEVRRRFDEIVDFSGVGMFIDTPVKRYSSGMYVRLAFSVAAHLETEILLVDEVLAVGDTDFQNKCLGKMKDITRQDRTVFFVSHNLGSIKSLCRRVLLLQEGKLVSDGDPEQVIGEYLQTNTQISESGNVPDDIPRKGSAEAIIQSLTMFDKDGNLVSNFLFGQPVNVMIGIKAIREVIDAMIEVSIISMDGTHIIQSFSTDNEKLPYHLYPGECFVDFSMNIPLLPQRYAFTLGIWSYKSGKPIDFVEHVFDFAVLNIGEDENKYYRWVVRGYISPAADWSISREVRSGEVPLGIADE